MKTIDTHYYRKFTYDCFKFEIKNPLLWDNINIKSKLFFEFKGVCLLKFLGCLLTTKIGYIEENTYSKFFSIVVIKRFSLFDGIYYKVCILVDSNLLFDPKVKIFPLLSNQIRNLTIESYDQRRLHVEVQNKLFFERRLSLAEFTYYCGFKTFLKWKKQ